MENQKIGRYEIKEELGRGGMATVFHAYDPQFKREVAIKMLPPETLHDKDFRARFEREATTIASLEHPAIVPVYDFGEDNGQPYLVMRFMGGGSLKDRIAEGPIALEEVVRIVSRIAPALDDAHKKGIVHRDIKPDNILFDQHNEPYLSDFGIAKLTENTATLTGNAIVGTPAYMSPEQGRGDGNIDGRSDLYSLGVIIFEMLTGRIPYDANTAMGQVFKHLTEPIPDIMELRKDLPAEIQSVIAQVMAKRSYVRFASASELADALTAVLKGEPIPMRRSISETMGAPGELHRRAPNNPARPSTVQSRSSSDQVRPSGVRPRPSGPVREAGTRNRATPAPKTTPRKRSGLLSALIILPILVGLGFGGWYFYGDQLTALLSGLSLPVAAANPATPTDLPTATFTLAPVVDGANETVEVAITETPTLIPPTATVTAVPPTNTPLPTPSGPVLGGADMLAFVSQNDIWISNLDGSELSQLTTTGGSKLNLNWTPDGRSITFIAGKCVQMVDIYTKAVSTVVCTNWAEYLGGFEISPDGDQVAISSSDGLYIYPYNLNTLNTIRTKSDLEKGNKCLAYTEFPSKAVRWSRDGKSVAVISVIADQGRLWDQIKVFDVSRCGQRPVRIDEFPYQKFAMNKYTSTPQIMDFAWDGDMLFALNVSTINGYGEIYLYNMSTGKAQVIDPLNKNCCYRSFQWSPNGEYFTFAFEDIRYASAPKFYSVIFGTIGTGATYQPLPFPEEILPKATENLQPALRPSQ